jgi:RNA polymerase sporulation-specific sigma factor
MSNTEANEFALKNKKLVFHISKGIRKLPSQKRDVEQEGMIGLLRAARTFNSSYNVSFATYASRCISNEIYMYYRREKKHRCNISWNFPIGIDGEGNEFTLMDVTPDPDSDFDTKIAELDLLKRGLLLVLNVLEGRQRLVILYRMANIRQEVIAEKLNLSRSYVSRIELKAHLRIKNFMDNQLEYEEVFSLPTVGKFFPIVFSSKKVSNFNLIFSSLLLKISSLGSLPDFKVSCNKERIVIFLPEHSDSFAFLAEIVREIDEYSMKYEPSSQDSAESESVQGENEQEQIKEEIKPEDAVVIEDESDEIISVNTAASIGEQKEVLLESSVECKCGQEAVPENSVDDKDQPDKVEVVSAKEESTNTDEFPSFMAKHSTTVREYFLTLDTFTTKELKAHFPNYLSDTIKNALYLAKQKGLIIQISRGQYMVAK